MGAGPGDQKEEVGRFFVRERAKAVLVTECLSCALLATGIKALEISKLESDIF